MKYISDILGNNVFHRLFLHLKEFLIFVLYDILDI